MTTAIGIDLGGTRIKGVVVTAGGEVIEQVIRPTQDGSGQAWKKGVQEIVEDLSANRGRNPISVGISAPGLPDHQNRAIAYMPGRLQGLENLQWSDLLKRDVWVLNDGVAALVAEAGFGAAKGKMHVAMLTLGTGVGGAILIDGKPYQGSFQKAGHLGHMVINDNGDRDVTGMPGSLEEFIGNVTLEKRSGGKFKSTDVMLEAMRKGDQFAREVWLTSVGKLAVGIASITNILSPELIVIGGGITDAGDDLFRPLREYVKLYEWRAGGNYVEIVKANFGEWAGAIGAALYAQSRTKN